jgi:hypothetical protein
MIRVRFPIATLLAGLTLSVAANTQPESPADTSRVVAVGDIHGAADGLGSILRAAGLIDAGGQWIGGRSHLVQTGDYLDRGERIREVMDLLMRLEGEARKSGGRVEALLGNHEAMNLLHEFRDVSPQAFASFADERSEDRRRRAYDEYVAVIEDRRTDTKPVSGEEWMSAHPPGFLEYVDALGPRGRYGRWLRSRKVATNVAQSIFMHAGLAPGSTGGLEDVNRTVSREIEQWDRLRETLARAGLIRPFFTLQETLDAVGAELTRVAAALKAGEPPGDHVTRELVDDMQWAAAIGKSALLGPDGPLWFRGLALLPETEEAQVTALLEQLGAARFVTAHTPILPGRITARFNNRVFLIDTGMLASHYKTGRPSALELQGGRISAIYPDSREVLVEQVKSGEQSR